MGDEVIDAFADLLTADNRAWFRTRPVDEQRSCAERHLEVLEGGKEHALGFEDTLNPDLEGVVLGDLQDPERSANAMIRQERQRRR